MCGSNFYESDIMITKLADRVACTMGPSLLRTQDSPTESIESLNFLEKIAHLSSTKHLCQTRTKGEIFSIRFFGRVSSV